MTKKDLLFFLDDFPDDAEVYFWNAKPRPVTVVKGYRTALGKKVILLNERKEDKK